MHKVEGVPAPKIILNLPVNNVCKAKYKLLKTSSRLLNDVNIISIFS